MDEPTPMTLGNATQNTQEFICIDEKGMDGANSTHEPASWGRLLSLNTLFSSFELVKNEYSFGRGKTCSIVWNSNELQTSKYFLAYSSKHFQIVRDTSKNYTYIVDLSTNGTFINGEKLGKNNQQILENNTEIALASKGNRAYIYMDSSAVSDSSIPSSISSKYIISKQIGRGTYGEVKLCFLRGTRDRYAMKIIRKKNFIQFGAQALVFNQQIKSECTILQEIHHPCIIKIHEVFETPDVVYIVLELVDGGELFDRIAGQGQFDEATAKFIFRQICIGVKYLHDNSITHRDLKPENILLSSPETNETLIKITDFGLSRFFNETSLMKTFCGTPLYLAPEVLMTRGEGTYTNKIDVWSLGVILYICLVGYPPFSESVDKPSLAEQIIKGLYTFPEEFWSGVSEMAKDLIRQMMCIDPSKRLTIGKVFEHPWLAHDSFNTERVEKIIRSSDEPLKTRKRLLVNDDASMYDASEISTTDTVTNGVGKRFKH